MTLFVYRLADVIAGGFEVADVEWAGFHSFAKLAPNLWFQRVVACSTPDEWSLIGIPPPGAPVWGPATLQSFGTRTRGSTFAVAERPGGEDRAGVRGAHPAALLRS